jgi:hypothetical protein
MGETCKQIREYIDAMPSGQMTRSISSVIEEHVNDCHGCRHSLTASRIASEFLRVRIEESEEAVPSPFFESIVMNAVRAKKVVSAPIAAFARWWKATSSILAFSASAAVILLVVALMTTVKEESPLTSSSNLYPTESVILDQSAGRDLTYEQVLQVVYNPRYEENK